MVGLEKIVEKTPSPPQEYFAVRPELIKNPNPEGIFAQITAQTNAVVKDNASLLQAIKVLENADPAVEQEVVRELEACRGGAISAMQSTLEELNLIGEN